MRGAAHYKTTQVNTASPASLVLTLLESALRHQLLAKRAAGEDNKMVLKEHLTIVREIFGELFVALDEEVDPEMVGQLKQLYIWVFGEVTKASRDGSVQRIDEVQRVTASLRDAWAHVAGVPNG